MSFLSVIQAEKIIAKTTRPLRVISLPLVQSLGKILAEDLTADRDQPSTDRSSMDGIAISFSAWQKGKRSFKIIGTQRAGFQQKTLSNKDDCLEIMTGAVIPKGCDCVIPIEYFEIKNNVALLKASVNVKRDQFIRKQGSEYQKGTVLLKKNNIINPNYISVAGSIGKSVVRVYSPRIAVIGTGDELVEIDKPVKAYQARRSNGYAIEAILKRFGYGDVKRFHFNDDLFVLRKGLKEILSKFDIIILSGGVSMGKFDFIPQVLEELGVCVSFHKVNQKPGKPFWYGLTREKKPVFALPGNPVSTQICAYRYLLPYLKKSAGVKEVGQFAILNKSVTTHSSFTLFLPVYLKQSSDAKTLAVPVHFAGSGDYAALTNADGFIELLPQKQKLPKGKRVKFFAW